MTAPQPELGILIREAAGRLAAVSDTPRLDASILAEHVFHKSPADLIRDADTVPGAAARMTYQNLIVRRLEGIPVAYLTGHREFWSLDLMVTDAVLIPRPDTELLVEQALARIPAQVPCSVLDLGTGSGAVALAIASERPQARVMAVDTSAAAIDIARANAVALDIRNVEFDLSDWFDALDQNSFDCIVSNPPYVADDDVHLTTTDIRFEPRAALASGVEGLDDLGIITANAYRYLRAGGWLLVEHGYDQGIAVRDLITAAGFSDIATRRDMGDRERVTEGQRV